MGCWGLAKLYSKRRDDITIVVIKEFTQFLIVIEVYQKKQSETKNLEKAKCLTEIDQALRSIIKATAMCVL